MKRPALKDTFRHPSWPRLGVHFINLIVICFASLSALFVGFAEQWDCKRALKEITEIQKLRGLWTADWFAKHATEKFVTEEPTYHGVEERFVDHCDFARLYMSEPQSHVLLDFRVKWWRSWREIGGPTDYLGQPSSWDAAEIPVTLSRFAEWWNELSRGVVFYKPLKMSMFGEMDHQESVPPVEISEENNLTGSNQWMRLDCIEKQEMGLFQSHGDPLTTLTLFPTIERQKDWLGIKAETIINEADWVFRYRVNVWSQLAADQKIFFAEFPDWRIGTFRFSFADLSRASAGMEQLDLLSVRNYLSSEADNYQHMTRIGTVQISTIRAAKSSIALLFALQLCMLAMWRRFPPVPSRNKPRLRRKMRKSIRVVFETLYWAGIAFCATAAIALNSGYVLREVFEKNNENIYSKSLTTALILIAVFLSALLGWRSWQKLRPSRT